MSEKQETSEQELLEELARLEHEQWATWTIYFLDNMNIENLRKWEVQAETVYEKLSEQEKESDRFWARKVLEIIKKKLR